MEVDYEYDKNNRLISKTEDDCISNSVITTSYDYDKNGNRIKKSYHTIYPNSTNKITLGIEDYQSDLTTDVETYTYDGFNRLTQISKEGGNVYKYAYYPNGLRLSKDVNGTVTYFQWDGDNIWGLSANASNALTHYYYRGLYGNIKDNYGTAFVYNGHGDVVKLTNSDGSIKRNYDYDAFGIVNGANSADSNPWRYCGEYYDVETDNIYLRARYYDPSVGAFINEDPIIDGVNWYSYCMGNPVMFVDSSGLEKIFVAGGAYVEKKGRKDYNYEFIDSALKAAFDASYIANGEKVTICLSTAGFSKAELDGIKNSVESYGINLEMFEDTDGLIKYINNRTDDKITTFEVFSHGGPGFVSFGMYTDREEYLVLDETQINKINPLAFNNCEATFYSCRAGNDTEDSDYILAQHWANVTGSNVIAPQGINKVGRIDVNTGRTDYSKIHARVYNIFYFDNYIRRKLGEKSKKATPAIGSPTINDGGHWQIFTPQ